METPVITSKAAVRELLPPLLRSYSEQGADALVAGLHNGLLRKKVKFPLLEYAAAELYDHISADDRETVTDKIIGLDEIGSYVLAGIFLQKDLGTALTYGIDKSVSYMLQGDKWYVCDILGERVQGHALLTQPGQTLPILRKLAAHPQPWIVRSVGVAGHYAVKKKLPPEYAEELFRLLLSHSGSKDFHVKKGIGWAAKTSVKFHPQLAEKYREEIQSPATGQWFRTKIRIGLGRSYNYSQRY